MKVTCSKNPLHDQFVTSAHEVHDWIVDEAGNFIEDLGCREVAHKPDPDNCWFCRICGNDAKVERE